MPGAGGTAGAGVSSPSPPIEGSSLPPSSPALPAEGRAWARVEHCCLQASAPCLSSLWGWLGGNCPPIPHVSWPYSPSTSSGVTALLWLAMATAWTSSQSLWTE